MTLSKKPVLALVLAAGKGTRMKSRLAKVLHEAGGKPLLCHTLDVLEAAGVSKTVVIVGHGERDVRALLGSRASAVRQPTQRGTGHAVLCAEPVLRRWKNLLLVVPGDAPSISVAAIQRLIKVHEQTGDAATILTAQVRNPSGYGRVLRQGGKVTAIREDLDTTEAEGQVAEINSGIYVFEVSKLLEHLRRVKPQNRKGELYLTDVIESFSAEGLPVGTAEALEEEVLGVNSRADLARAEKVMTRREIEKHQANGVTFISPDHTFIGPGVAIGNDAVIYPFTWIERNVKIGSGCRIGPYAVIREGSEVKDSAVIGCFVEIVRSKIGARTRVKHLAYVGDAELGADVNIGAGAITANFDGVRKHKTVVEKGALIGSNTVLVAPVKVGRGARTGAGAIVLSGSGVPARETAVGIPARIIRKKRKNL